MNRKQQSTTQIISGDLSYQIGFQDEIPGFATMDEDTKRIKLQEKLMSLYQGYMKNFDSKLNAHVSDDESISEDELDAEMGKETELKSFLMKINDEKLKTFKKSIEKQIDQKFSTKRQAEENKHRRQPKVMLIMHTTQSVEANKKQQMLGISLYHIYSDLMLFTFISSFNNCSTDGAAKQVAKSVDLIKKKMQENALEIAGYSCAMSPIFKELLKDTKHGDDLVLPDVFDLVITIIANIWMGKSVNFGDVKFQFDPYVLDQVFPDDNPLKKSKMTFNGNILDMKRFLAPENIGKLYKHHKIVDSLTPEEKYQQTEVFKMLHDLMEFHSPDADFSQKDEDFLEGLDKIFERFEIEGADPSHLHVMILQNSVRRLPRNLLAFYRKYGVFNKGSTATLALEREFSDSKGKTHHETLTNLLKKFESF